MKRVLLLALFFLLAAFIKISDVFAATTRLKYDPINKEISYTFEASSMGVKEAYLNCTPYTLDEENEKVITGEKVVISFITYDEVVKTKETVTKKARSYLKYNTIYACQRCLKKGASGVVDCVDGYDSQHDWFVVSHNTPSPTRENCRKISVPAFGYDYFNGVYNCLYEGCNVDKDALKCSLVGKVGETTTTTKPTVEPAPSTCEEIFGSFYNDLQYGVKAYKIIAPLAVLLFSVMDYLKAIFSKDAEGLKDANKRLIKRGILLVVLFFLPTILDLMIHLFIGTEFGTCLG